MTLCPMMEPITVFRSNQAISIGLKHVLDALTTCSILEIVLLKIQELLLQNLLHLGEQIKSTAAIP